ncbi:MAG: alpha/beta hydrolase [Flavicella sp.]
MKKHCYLILLLLIPLLSKAQEYQTKDILSTFLEELKEFKVFVPKNYSFSKNNYPLSIVLDADELFDSYVSTAKLYASKGQAPSQIIVGISQDLPSLKERDYGYEFTNSYPTESSVNTLGFIKQELVPYMEKNFRISSFKTIVGIGITANFSNYFLMDEVPTFQSYININPSYAPDLYKYIKEFAAAISEDEVYYYIGHGNNLTEKESKLINSIDKQLMGIDSTYFHYNYEKFPKSRNFVSIPQGLASAQAFTFENFSPVSKEEFNKNIAFLSPKAAMEYLIYKYENIEYLYGQKTPIRIDDFIAVENIIMDKENGDYLKEFGELALEKHPKDALGNYYIGKFYEDMNDLKLALKQYKIGYSKIPRNAKNSEAFYKNIERIIALKADANNKISEEYEDDFDMDAEDNYDENSEDDYDMENDEDSSEDSDEDYDIETDEEPENDYDSNINSAEESNNDYE